MTILGTNQRANTTVCGFTNALEWATDENIRKLVYPSSGSVYGNTSLPQSEGMIPNPTNLYGVGKLACEMIVRTYQDRVPNVGLRIFAGYGPGEGHKGEFASVFSLFVASILQGKSPVIYGDGTQTRDFVYIDDVVKAMVAAIKENVENEIVNVGSGKSYSFNEVAAHVSNILGRDVKPTYVDKPQRYLENTLADTSKMTALFGMDPIGLEQD